MAKISKEEMDKIAREALNDGDQEKWENGELGNSAEHAKPIMPPAMKKTKPNSIDLSDQRG